ncbi:MAG: SUR7/PalI family protein [Clostridia bacterium]|nr:SUR7/PalI family protein [Clostridia bacterium]
MTNQMANKTAIGAMLSLIGGDAGMNHKSFCIGWVLFIFACLMLAWFIGYLVSKKKRGCGLAGLCASGAVLVFGIIAICLHQCVIAIIGLVLAALAFSAFLIAFLKKGKAAPVEIKEEKKEEVKEEAPAPAPVKEVKKTEKVEKETGYYRITEDGAGKCTFVLFDDEGDHLSKEMGVFATEKEARDAIAVLRKVGKSALVENRVGDLEDSLPEPKFVLDVTNKGVYRYTLFGEGGEILLQSVQYLNEKRCVIDLKKTLVCIAAEEIRVAEGEAKNDVIEEVEEFVEEPVATVAEEVAEEIVDDEAEEAIEEFEDELIAEEDLEEDAEAFAEDAEEVTEEELEEHEEDTVSLKENLAIAKATVSHSKVHKQYVADYLKGKYDDGVELNRRENETKTGLPLADTHYAVRENHKNVCFVYVYEVGETTMLLVKLDEKYGNALAEKHELVKRSAFPKAKHAWYSVIVDDTFPESEIQSILDEAYGYCGGKRKEGLSLKESLAAAKATVTKVERTKKGIAGYLAADYGDAVELNCRGNRTRTGLPLADTHYAINGDKKACFVYVYEVGAVVLLIRLPEDYAEKLAKTHPTVKRSAFPKAPNPWYSVILDDSFPDDAVDKVLRAAHDAVLN